jgi:phosphopantetheine--protein transferase-like protein
MIGIDIQEVERMETFIETPDRMERMFSRKELDYISRKGNAIETITGMFCAKEAFFKAVGSGINISQLTGVEIGHQASGAPYYILSPEIIKQHSLSTANINLSISHTKNVAIAVCVITTGADIIKGFK